MLITVLSILEFYSQKKKKKNLCKIGKLYQSQFTGVGVETQRGEVTCFVH